MPEWISKARWNAENIFCKILDFILALLKSIRKLLPPASCRVDAMTT